MKNVEENKKKVITALKNNEIDMAITTKWPFMGEFLKFIEKKFILSYLKKIEGTQKRNLLGKYIYALLYMLKIIVGIPRARGSEELLSDAGAMSLLGFSVDNLNNGLCNRGDANQYGKDYKKNTLVSWTCLH